MKRKKKRKKAENTKERKRGGKNTIKYNTGKLKLVKRKNRSGQYLKR